MTTIRTNNNLNIATNTTHSRSTGKCCIRKCVTSRKIYTTICITNTTSMNWCITSCRQSEWLNNISGNCNTNNRTRRSASICSITINGSIIGAISISRTRSNNKTFNLTINSSSTNGAVCWDGHKISGYKFWLLRGTNCIHVF